MSQATWTDISGGTSFTCGLTVAGVAYCWGRGGGGTLGTGTTAGQDAPTLVAGGMTFSKVSAGGDIACGIAAGGVVYCWGAQNGRGVSEGAPPQVNVPTLVSGLAQSVAITAGLDHACALETDGIAYCWGQNLTGQAGTGTGLTRGDPVTVAGARHFAQISAGRLHTCGVTVEGAIYCWGSDKHGQLGNDASFHCLPWDSTVQCSYYPLPVSSTLTFTSVSAGFDHTCALATDGTAWCWGSSATGALGHGPTAGLDIRTPVVVEGGLHFKAISAGKWFTCGLTTDGQAYCWGANDAYQMGNSTAPLNGAVTSPVPVATSERFVSIDAGEHHTCATTADGVAWCWGTSGLWKPGRGQPGGYDSPVRVPG